jgi:hypothetical protein
MSATRWILGCTLVATVSSPVLAARAAGDMGAQDLGQRTGSGTSARARTIDSGTGGGGDLSGPTTSRSSDAPAGTGSESGDGDRTGSLPVSTGERQAPSAHSNVGWQSLLPGSIQ